MQLTAMRVSLTAVQLRLGNDIVTLALTPHEIRSEGFKFLMPRNVKSTLIVHADRDWKAMLVISSSIKRSVSPGFLSLGIGFTE